MLRDRAVSRIQQALGFRDDKKAEIVDALQDAQEFLEEAAMLPFFLRTEVASITTIIGEERVEVPDDFIREWDEDALWYFDGTAPAADQWVNLVKEELEILRKDQPGDGAPVAYSLDNRYFRIFPTPDEIFTLKSIYYKHDAILTTNIENLWLDHAPFLLIGMAGTQLAVGFRDSDAITLFAKWEAEGKTALLASSIARDLNNRKLQMGGSN